MKNRQQKIIAVLLIICIAFTFAGCGKKAKQDTLQDYLDKQGISKADLDAAVASAHPAATAAPGATNAPTATPEASATASPTATATATPTPTPTAKPTPTPTPKNPPVLYPKVTKDPTSETLTEGGNAIFIAYADNYQYLSWQLVSPDGTVFYNMNEAPYYFTGLSVNGDGTSKLTLCNCPLSLNGWKVQCNFTGNGKTVTTARASVNVTAAPKAQLYASPSAGYVQFCDQTVYLFAGDGDSICYTLYRGNSYGSEKYTEGIIKSGEAVYLGCDNGVCWTYSLYAYVANDSGNAVSCQYTVDGISYDEEHTIYATECDQYGFSYTQVSTDGLYRFSPKHSDGVTWDVYVLNEVFSDSNRYIPQAYNAVVSGSGTAYVSSGSYVYVHCSANDWDGTGPAPDGCRINFKIS